MAYKVFLPKLGANMTEGKIEKWFIEEGETIDHGDPLFELVTDKAAVDVEAESRGVLRKILVEEGETVPIVTTVAIIAGEDEDLTQVLEEVEKEKAATKAAEEDKIKKAEEEPSKIPTLPHTIKIHPRAPDKVYAFKPKASPKARKRAKELGIDLSEIKPTDDRLIITLEDVENHKAGSSKKRCVIIGAGQYSSVIREILDMDEEVEVTGLIDDNQSLSGKTIEGLPVLGGSEKLSLLKDEGIEYFIVSVGVPKIRSLLFNRALDAGLKPISAIHPQAAVSASARVDDGSVIEAFAVIAVKSIVERGVFVTQNCSVSHDCRLGEFCHLAPGCHMGGSVDVGRGALIGVGCSLAPSVKIGDNSIITPGTSVGRNVGENLVIEGVPGREIGRKSESSRI